MCGNRDTGTGSPSQGSPSPVLVPVECAQTHTRVCKARAWHRGVCTHTHTPACDQVLFCACTRVHPSAPPVFPPRDQGSPSPAGHRAQPKSPKSPPGPSLAPRSLHWWLLLWGQCLWTVERASTGSSQRTAQAFLMFFFKETRISIQLSPLSAPDYIQSPRVPMWGWTQPIPHVPALPRIRSW